MEKNRENQKRCMSCMSLIDQDQKVCPHCGFQEEYYQVEFYHLPVGQTLQEGRYQIGRVIGEGGFGLTYIGWDGKFSQVVAVKEFYSKEMVSRDNTVSYNVRLYKQSDEEKYRHDLERVEREAKTLKQFAGHPGIVRVEDFFEENNTIYIVMEYVEGRTLEQYLEQTGGRMDEEKCLSMFRQLLRSLHSIHKAGVVHRDISMTNIMVRQDESLVLVDFGSARPLNRETKGVTVKLGYAPLEQYMPDENNQGPWQDVYTICVCLYKCLTGRSLLDAKIRGQEDIWQDVGNDVKVGRNLKNTLKKGLELDYRKRIQSINQIYEELYGEWLESPGLKEDVPKADKNRKGNPWKQWLMKYKKQALVSCGAAAVLIVLVLGAVYLRQSISTSQSGGTQPVVESEAIENTKATDNVETQGEQKEEKSGGETGEEESREETREEEWTDQEGNRYIGVRKNGLLEGDGICVYANGDKYTGQWVNGRPNGEGTREYADGGRYEGEFKDGLKEGEGVFSYTNGDIYDGEWVDDHWEGKGTYYWKDGGRYEGEWVNGKYEGYGINSFSSGDRYEGEYVNGEREGQGIFYWKDGHRYEGEWVNDKRQGYGTMTYPDGDRYEGEWVNSKCEGYGTKIYSDGNRYEGEWVNGKKEGQGIYYWKEGDRYEGGWVNGKREGCGTMTYSNGDRYEGEWANDHEEGNGTYTSSNGDRFEGKWANDHMEGNGTHYLSGDYAGCRREGVYDEEGNLSGQAIFYWADGSMVLEHWEKGEKISEEPLGSE